MPLHPHIVLSCSPNWSHFRSLCVFAARLSNVAFKNPTTITVLVINQDNLLYKVTAEIARCQSIWNDRHAEIRIIEVGTSKESFLDIWSCMIGEQPIESSWIGHTYATVSSPAVVILDGFQLDWLRAVRAFSQPAPPILQWMMGFSGGYMRMVAPARLGGLGGFCSYLANMSPSKIASIRTENLPFTGVQVQVPGMPPVRDWAQYPQQLPEPQASKILEAKGKLAAFVAEADGLLTACAPAYDGEACLHALSEWIAEKRGRPTFHFGPLMPLGGNLEANSGEDQSNNRALSFLDEICASHGPRSTLYICFGTQHFPSSPSHLAVLLHVLIRRRIPFIFVHPARSGLSSTALLPSSPSTPDAPYLLLPWAPQQSILAHPATSFFLTHGGYNGTMEALLAGVPIIGWPFAVDQPLNVVYLARSLGVAVELQGVKTGYWANKAASKEAGGAQEGQEAWEQEVENVLDLVLGDRGERMRVKAEAIRRKLRVAWDDGSASGQFDLFVRTFLNT